MNIDQLESSRDEISVDGRQARIFHGGLLVDHFQSWVGPLVQGAALIPYPAATSAP